MEHLRDHCGINSSQLTLHLLTQRTEEEMFPMQSTNQKSRKLNGSKWIISATAIAKKNTGKKLNFYMSKCLNNVLS